MGMFPYTCGTCSGAYKRCGYKNCENDCPGGQFCYEDDVVIFVNGNKFTGVYNGYGQVETDNGTIYIPSEFDEFIEGWGTKLTYDPKNTKVIIYCKSCYPVDGC
jgi:hypothetical protein